ncbi:hypothetical protein JCGZ_14922 [Jatropha curcas]|uniref:Uncharacterized protein n=1 Tax=Jatropha curcas TaxID=180498 RepID=A0A067LMH8_JATCU|nr:hypothetical protein JCGZ_14922 [Jatropha curcas]
MGGCASRPKDSAKKPPAPLPRDVDAVSPRSPKEAEKTSVAAAAPENKGEGEKKQQETNVNNNGGEEKTDLHQPLIDLSEPEKEGGGNAEPVPVDSGAVLKTKDHNKVEVVVAASAPVVVDKENITADPAKVEEKDAPLVVL